MKKTNRSQARIQDLWKGGGGAPQARSFAIGGPVSLIRGKKGGARSCGPPPLDSRLGLRGQ